MKELTAKVSSQNHNRREWAKNDTPESVAHQIVEESQELVEAIANFDTHRDAEYSVISEIGDVLYLALKLCGDLGIDPAEAVELKLLRNSAKYPDYFSSNGWGYEQSREMSKSLWQHLGGDHAFFMWHALVYPLKEPVDGQNSVVPQDNGPVE